MSTHNSFQQSQDQYFRLKGQLTAGRITQEQFDAALKDLMVQDAAGRWWMIGSDTGKWYYHDGTNWVEAVPTGATHAATPTTPPTAAPEVSQKSSRVFVIAAGIVVGLVVLGAIAFLLWSNLASKTFQAPTTSIPSAPTQILVPSAQAPAGGPTRLGGGPGRIAFVTNRDGGNAIYVMNPDGSQPTNLLSMPGTVLAPAWSPDGNRMIFTSNRDGRNEIYVMNANGGYPTRLTNHPAGSWLGTWSPDGARIAFESPRDGDLEIYVMNADGSRISQLTSSPGDDETPTWSPDGRRIAFASTRDGSAEIYVMNSDGSQPVRLTNTNKNQYWPSWSPDGARIAFSSNRDGNYEIYVMNGDGSEQTRLTRTTADDRWPTWSADSKQIYFGSLRDGNWQIYAMKLDGSEQVRISNNTAAETWPATQPREPLADALKTPPAVANAFATLWLYTPTLRPPTATVTVTVSTVVTGTPIATLPATAAVAPTVPITTTLGATTTVAPTAVITSGQDLPDLVVEIVSIDSTTIVRNQTPWVWLHYRVKNIGTGATPAGMKIRLCSYSNNTRNSGYMEVKELASGELAEGQFAVASGDYWPLGAQTIHLQVDYENAIVERNETNNLSNVINVQVITPTAPVTPTATATSTLTPMPTNTPLPPPGVYVTRLRMEPPNPNAVENIRFFATFLNTAGPLQFKWCVFVYNLGATNARGQTSCDQLLDFPAGTYEYATINTWRLGPGTPCTDLVARVQGIDTGGGRFLFKMPDLSENSFTFRVCP